MERVAFLLADGSRVSAMLNPETLLVRRRAGVVQRASGEDSITGSHLTDDRVLYTGGGTTELIIELLFDLAVAGSTTQPGDVRDLTRPLVKMAESIPASSRPRLPAVRFIWGKAWNVPGVVADVVEKLEAFDAGGAPRRSLMTMRFLRVNEDDDLPESAEPITSAELQQLNEGALDSVDPQTNPEFTPTDRVLGGRADVVASRVYGSETLWRLVLASNGILDATVDLTGKALVLPPRSILRGSRG